MAEGMKALDSESDVLMIYSTKNYHRPNNFHSFDVFGRVMSGTVHKGQRVKVWISSLPDCPVLGCGHGWGVYAPDELLSRLYWPPRKSFSGYRLCEGISAFVF